MLLHHDLGRHDISGGTGCINSTTHNSGTQHGSNPVVAPTATVTITTMMAAVSAISATMTVAMRLRWHSQHNRQQTGEEDRCAFHKKLTV